MKKISAFVLSILVLSHVSVRAADAIIISEFMAANNLSLVDENGNHEDWIEIMNIGESPVNLTGWALTDDPSRPMQWVFPATNLAPNQTMVIFASGKNRLQPGLPLHTNFKLSNNGEYLALVRPDGSVAMQFAPAFPRQVADVSYGVAMESAQVGLLGQGSPAKVLLPTDDSNSTNWIRLDYDDSSWTTVTNGLGFARQQPPAPPSATVADSVADFSGTQGLNNWYYGYWDFGGDADGIYAPSEFVPFPREPGNNTVGPNNAWDGSKWDLVAGTAPWDELGPNGGHPNKDPVWHYVIRRWVSEVEGRVRLVGYLSDGGECGDGVDLKIFVDGTQVYSTTAFGNTREFGVSVSVSIGSKIDFAVGPNTANDWCDGFNFAVKILQGAIADSVEDWSSTGQQGSRGWSYGYYDKSADGDGVYQATDFILFNQSQWNGSKWDLAPDTAPWTEITQTGGHPASSPGEHWAIRRWTSDYTGKVLLSCRLGNYNGCSGGIRGRVFKDGQQIFEQVVSGSATAFWIPVDVVQGTLLDFAIDPNGSDGCDGSAFMIRIQEATPAIQLVADAEAEWVAGAQGSNNWFYGYYNKVADGDGIYNADTDFITSDPNWIFDGQWHFGSPTWPPWTSIGPTWGHPNGYNSSPGEQWAIQRWVSTVKGQIAIAWNHRKQNGGGGTTIKVFKNGQQIGASTVGGDFTGINTIITTTVELNDKIDFALTPVGPDNAQEDWADGTQFKVVIFRNAFDPAATSTLLADSRADWSASGQQGYKGWYYGYYNKTADGDGTYNPATDFNRTDINWSWDGGSWRLGPGDPPWDWIAQDNAHPNGINNAEEHWVIRRWVSTYTGTLRVDWRLAKISPYGSGVTGIIMHNGAIVDSKAIAGNNTAGINRITTIPGVNAGDLIEIALSPIGPNGETDDGADGSVFYATIYGLDSSINTVVADSIADWSPAGQQGYRNWYYGLYDKTDDPNGTYQSTDFVGSHPDWNFTGSAFELGYQGNIYANPPWNRLDQYGGHPNGTNSGGVEIWTIRRWVSTFSGPATIVWRLAAAATCGGGTTVRVFHNGQQVDVGGVAGNDTIGITRTVNLPSINVGDTLDIALTPLNVDGSGHDGCDSANFSATIYRRDYLTNYFTSNVESLMAGRNATLYARFPFTVNDPSALDRLTMRIRYDDGFVAYLNGVEIARRNAPSYQAGGLLANSRSEFSSTQGANNWFHGYYDRTSDPNSIYETSDFRTDGGWYWRGSDWGFGSVPPWSTLGDWFAHPNGSNSGHHQWVIRRWLCEASGSIRVNLRAAKQNPNCGNGVTFRVFHNGTEIFAKTVAANDTAGFTTNLAVASVQVGDLIDVALDPTGTDGSDSDGCDGSYFAVTIDQEAVPDLSWNSSATAPRPSALSLVAEEFDLTGFLPLLQSGQNVLAIHALNKSAEDSDFLLAPELTAVSILPQTNALVYFTQPTPGDVNGLGTTNLGPLLSGMAFQPNEPLPGQDVTVTVRATAALNPVASLTLRYRVMYGPEQELPMFDDGQHGDGAAGDGVWGATIPVSTQASAGQMVRWYLIARDSAGIESRNPAFLNPYNSPEYFGTMVHDPAVVTPLPVLYWFVQNPSAANNYSGTRCSIYYKGQFFDNIAVRLHGQSTAGFPKKSYNFDLNSGYHLQYDDHQPALEEFVLFSTYADKSHMRNVLAYDAYADTGVPAHFAFPIRVQQNGQFHSLANFSENANSHFLERLGLDPAGALYKLYNTLNSSTAGVEKKTRRSENNNDLQSLINNLNTPDDNTRKTYMFDNLDIAEIVNYMATRSPITGDNDWGHKNYYLYRDTLGTGLWQAMPQDVDLSFGHNWTCGNPCLAYFDDTIYTNTDFYAGYNVLFNQFKNLEPFRTMWLRRVRTLMDTVLQPPDTPLQNDRYHTRMHTYAARMASDAALDFALWQPSWGLGPQTLTQALQRIDASAPENYLPGRRRYLFNTLSVTNGGPIPLPQPSDLYLTIGNLDYNPISGNQNEEYVEIINTNTIAMDISGWRVQGAIRHTFKPGTVIPAGGSLFLVKDVAAFRARATSPKGGEQRFIQGNYQGQLSARGETLVVVDAGGNTNTTLTYTGSPSLAQQYLRITELMYHPAPGGSFDKEEYEYIELKNIGPVAINLAGVHFTDGIEFSFNGSPITVLNPGERVLVVKNPAAFASRYGNGLPVAGTWSGSLNNAGERIRLADGSDEPILDFTYDNRWYPITDGAGFALAIVDENAPPASWDIKESWRPNGVLNGTPGTDNVALPAFAPIVINEILTYSIAPEVDAIELLNPTENPVDIGGWFITDNFNIPKKYRIPDGTIIPAGGYMVFTEANFNPNGNGFAFNSSGEEAYLFSGDSATNLTGYVQGYKLGAANPGVTFGRYTNSVGDVHFVAMAATTLGTNNSSPLVGPVVISEIMYHPPALWGQDNTTDEYIELLNISQAPVALFDTNNPANTWRIRGGVQYDFPTNTILPPGGVVLLVNFDPLREPYAVQHFRNQYGIAPEVPLYGPYAGKLDNDNDVLELYQPGAPESNNVPYVLIDRVAYSDSAPWPSGADGSGLALSRVSVYAYGDDPANWSATTPNPLTVPLEFRQPLQNITAECGIGTATLDGTVAGSSPVSYSWYFSTEPPSGQLLTGQNNPLLVLANPSQSQEGAYWVVASNSVSVITSLVAWLHVVDSTPPVLLTNHGAIYLETDGSGQIALPDLTTPEFVSAADACNGFQLLQTPPAGSMLTPGVYPVIVSATDDAQNTSSCTNLVVICESQLPTIIAPPDKIGVVDAGSCQVSNLDLGTPLVADNCQILMVTNNAPASFPFGVTTVTWTVWDSTGNSASASQTVTVHELPPVIAQQPANLNLAPGDSAQLSAIVNSCSPPVYQWYYLNTPLPSATNATLTLANVQPTDGGSYYLVAANTAGATTSAVANIYVQPAAHDLSNNQTAENQALNITLSGQGIPGSTLTYYIMTGPLHGTVTIENGIATYIPDPLFNGRDTFEYVVSDGVSTSAVATVTVDVAYFDDVKPYAFTNAVTFPAGTSPRALAVIDLKKDLRIDLAVADYTARAINLLTNNGFGTFTNAAQLPVGGYPVSVQAVDVNKDGVQDLVVAIEDEVNSGVEVYTNVQKTGQFALAQRIDLGANLPAYVAVADVYKDGLQDILVVEPTAGQVAVYKNDTGSSWSWVTNAPAGSNPRMVAVGTLNKDTLLDIAVVNDAGVSVFMGRGNGQFSNAVNYAVGTDPAAVVLADFNGDKKLDIAVANSGSDDVTVLTNILNGVFANAGSFGVGFSIGQEPSALVAAELNKDGKPDLAVALAGVNSVEVMLGRGTNSLGPNGQPIFTYYWGDPGAFYAVGDTPVGIVAADLNKDMLVDVATVNRDSGDVSVLLNNLTPLAYKQKLTLLEDVPTNITLHASFGPLSYLITQYPTNGSWTTTDSLDNTTNNPVGLYTPNQDFFGNDTILFQVTDGFKTSKVAQIAIKVLPVNDQPSFGLATNQVVSLEDKAVVFTNFIVNLVKGPANERLQTVKYYVVADNTNLFAGKLGQPTIMGTNLKYTPAKNVYGRTTVRIWVQDSGKTLYGGVDTSATNTFDIEIVNENDAPVISRTLGRTIFEDSWTNFVFMINDLETAPDDLLFSVSSTNTALLPDNSTNIVVERNGTNVVVNVYPVANMYGKTLLTFTVGDGTNSASVTGLLTVNPINDAPSFELAITNIVVGTNVNASYTNHVISVQSAGPNEVQGLKYVIVNNTNPGLFATQPAINAATGNLTFKVKGGRVTGEAVLTIKLTDLGGTLNGGVNESPTRQLTIRVGS